MGTIQRHQAASQWLACPTSHTSAPVPECSTFPQEVLPSLGETTVLEGMLASQRANIFNDTSGHNM